MKNFDTKKNCIMRKHVNLLFVVVNEQNSPVSVIPKTVEINRMNFPWTWDKE